MSQRSRSSSKSTYSSRLGRPRVHLRCTASTNDVAGEDARIKWPNDVVLPREARLLKLAGILAEGRPQEGWAVLGIGLNVSVELDQLPAELQRSAASLERPREELEPMLARLLEALARRLCEPPQQLLEAWRARDALAGRAVAWSGGRGVAEGIDGASRRIVERSDGGLRRRLLAGVWDLDAVVLLLRARGRALERGVGRRIVGVGGPGFAPAARIARAAFGEVAHQLARKCRRLARHPRASPAQRLL